MQHAGSHSQDLALHLRARRAQIALQEVGVRVEAEDAVEEGVMLHAAVIERAGDLAAIPLLVLRLSHGGELGEDFLGGTAVIGNPGVGGEAILVRMQVAECGGG